ncbi:SigE family RNA polymerase sigma factor [uncultured Jatrophihabitans sp.]|uniref:SigE family RNA polymerase sigma factor n=1 Tax=uncultured Jatrophihabitans sp. TaxID=1610747 RepID=UPI0035CB4B98
MSESFESFALRELQPLLRYAALLTGDGELARDLVQDVMLKVHSRWDEISIARQPHAYVRAMITNAHLSWRRRWSVRNVVLGHRVAIDALSVADHAAELSERAAMWSALAVLPRQQRAAIVLRFYEGLNDSEAADALGCSAGTVRGYISRALATLRAQLDEQTLLIEDKR